MITSPRRSPSVAEAPDKATSLQTLQDTPNVRRINYKGGIKAEMKLIQQSEFLTGQSPQGTARLRKALKNPTFVKLLAGIIADMEKASQSPLRKIVILYHGDEPLYPSEEVILHVSAHQTIREFLVLCARQGRIRPLHPDFPPGSEAFTRRVIRNPMLQSNHDYTNKQENH